MEDSRSRRPPRVAACTETAWCHAVPGGTGTAVIAISSAATSVEALNIELLQNALNKLQNSHPVLKSKLHYDPVSSTFSFLTSPTPFVEIKTFQVSETSKILNDQSTPINNNNNNNSNNNQHHAIFISPLQILLEHELNENSTWRNLRHSGTAADMLFVSIYLIGSGKWVAVFRLHVAACDRTTAVSLLEELLDLMSGGGGGGGDGGDKKGEMEMGMEDLIPAKLGKKPLLARGMDVISYSVNSLRLTNLKFRDVKSPRRSQVARLQMNRAQTNNILSECKSRGLKLSSVMVAAGLMAAHSSGSQYGHRQQRKYGIITLIDCRRFLDPPLSSDSYGFYYAAIMNSYTIRGGEDLWKLAKKVSTTFEASKNSNKHLTDLSNLNFLMCRAIENPSLTASGAQRTSLISVFEDTVVNDSDEMLKKVGIEDCMGCASVHGIGPSISVFDTIRNGQLDCVCAYPAPLHSREQMEALVDHMKALLVKG